MDIKIVKVRQYNSTNKHLLMIDEEPVCIATGINRINECVQYIYGHDADINDGKIRKILDKYRQPITGKETKMKKRQKERHKAIHKFNESIA